jgi:quinone-modifying oxidoreductase, subunit QmoC
VAKDEMLNPDLDFKRRILGLGAHDLGSCYQCGTCSVVCPISTESDPFPRKEMVWVQWGLKDRLMADPSVWLCHQCSVCNTYCPRDAKPANVMAALRDYGITHYAEPAFMGEAVNQLKYLPLLFAAPITILLAVLAGLGHLATLPEGEVVFSKFLPVRVIEAVFTCAVGLAALAAIAGGVRYWRAIESQRTGDARFARRSVVETLRGIFSHEQFRRCGENAAGIRKSFKAHLHVSHLAVFYGFMGLVVTTASVGIGIYAFRYLTPWPLWHPVKILGNLSGMAVIAGLGVFVTRRLMDKEKAGKSTYSDWLFLTFLGVTALTGFLSEIARLAGLQLAYWVYFVHLVFIFCLLVYLPYSKLAHLVYRFVAMLYSPPGLTSRNRG